MNSYLKIGSVISGVGVAVIHFLHTAIHIISTWLDSDKPL